MRPSGGQASGGQASGGQASGGQASGGQASGGQASGGQASGGQASGGQETLLNIQSPLGEVSRLFVGRGLPTLCWARSPDSLLGEVSRPSPRSNPRRITSKMAKKKRRSKARKRQQIRRTTVSVAEKKRADDVSLKEEYHYVFGDLKRMSVLATGMFALMIVLAFILQ